MADDYIGRKMEDLRAGRLGGQAVSPQTPRKGILQIPFPSRRVVVAVEKEDICREVSRSFAKSGCRVSVIHPERSVTDELSKEGIRIYTLEGDVKDGIEVAMRNLLGAWHDVDVVVTGEEYAVVVATLLSHHRQETRIPNFFGGRYIVIRKAESENDPVSREKDSDSGEKEEIRPVKEVSMAELDAKLSEFGIAVNRVTWGGEMPDSGCISRLCLFLSAPGTDTIRTADIPVSKRTPSLWE